MVLELSNWMETTSGYKWGFSLWEEVRSGVPQGSILGPVLFLLYVNDMPDHDIVQNANVVVFADDSKCYRTVKSLLDVVALQEDLNALSQWSVANELYFQQKNVRKYYVSSSEEIKIVSNHRDLGVSITSDLSWNMHIDSISAKSNKMLGFLRRITVLKICLQKL